jgi:hypothetical protein
LLTLFVAVGWSKMSADGKYWHRNWQTGSYLLTDVFQDLRMEHDLPFDPKRNDIFDAGARASTTADLPDFHQNTWTYNGLPR